MTTTPERAPAGTGEGVDRREFAVEGMTCASCAARVQKTLNKQPGVTEAQANFATGHAQVTYESDQASVHGWQTAVDHLGYQLEPLEPKQPSSESTETEQAGGGWLWRIGMAWPLALAIFALTMVFGEHAWARWAAFAAAVPVQFVTGWPFLTVAAQRAHVQREHGHAHRPGHGVYSWVGAGARGVVRALAERSCCSWPCPRKGRRIIQSEQVAASQLPDLRPD